MINSIPVALMVLLSISNTQAATCSSLNNDPFFNEILKQLKNQNIDCSGMSSHLTFDDGPNEKTTEPILNELKKRNIKATFFVTTTNLSPKNPHSPERTPLVNLELKYGHTVASHGHEHNAYDLRITQTKEAGYSSAEREKQINESVKLLNLATNGQFSKQPIQLFRFPYGRGASPSQKEIEEMEQSKKWTFQGDTYAEKLKEYRRQSPALRQIADHNFSHLAWNHDSKDSSLPMTMPDDETVKKYVRENIQAICHPSPKMKVSLFHDIKEINTRAIPLIIDIGSCLGVKFVTPKEMMSNKAQLSQEGVLISNENIMKSTVATVDQLGDLLKSLNTKGQTCPETIPKNPTNGCYSTYYKKTFLNCQGDTSKCFEGKWYNANDPFIILNCGS